MFVGHLAAALAARKVEPRLPLAALVAATYGLDLLWPAFLLGGLETVRAQPGITAFTPIDFESYPWSHSLLFAGVWGGLAAFVASRTGRSRPSTGSGRPERVEGRAALVIFALVVSHWVLDWVTHRPDLPLWPGGPKTGLGLWYSLPATIVVEGALLGLGVALYLRSAPATSRVGHLAFWSLIVFTAAIWLSGPFQPPPPDVGAIALVGLVGGALLILWAGWIDRTRRSVRPPAP